MKHNDMLLSSMMHYHDKNGEFAWPMAGSADDCQGGSAAVDGAGLAGR